MTERKLNEEAFYNLKKLIQYLIETEQFHFVNGMNDFENGTRYDVDITITKSELPK